MIDEVIPTSRDTKASHRPTIELSIQATDSPATPFPPGTELAQRYKIIEHIGAGAMGWVVRALDSNFNDQEIALKLLYPHLMTETAGVRQFHSEILIARKLLHNNIVRTHSFGRLDDSTCFISMEYVAGRTLAEIINIRDSYPLENCLSILFQIARGLSHAHSHGVVHRDIKPENILVSNDEIAKVADFGISQFWQSTNNQATAGKAIGTPYYMSPEQFRGEALDATTDIYSFGILAYELVTGVRPFNGSTLFLLAHQHEFEELPPTRAFREDLPQWLEEMIKSCAEKNRASRFQAFDEIVSLIKPHIPDTVDSAEKSLRPIHIAIDDHKSVQNHRFDFVADEQQKFLAILLRCTEILCGISLLLTFYVNDPTVRNTLLLILGVSVMGWFALQSSARNRLLFQFASGIIIVLFIIRTNPATWKRVGAFVLNVERVTNYNLSPIKWLCAIEADTNSAASVFMAAAGSKKDYLFVLLGSGANVDIFNDNGEHVMHIAARDGHPGTVRQLILAGVRIDAQDPAGRTPLHYAAVAKDGVSANKTLLLLEAGSNANAVDHNGRTPLWDAATAANWERVVMMVRAGGVIEQSLVVDQELSSALHLSVLRAPQSALESILAKVNNIDVEDAQGRTPLHALVRTDRLQRERVEKIEMLLRKGASPEQRDTDGKSAIDYAAELGDEPLLKILRESRNSH